MKQDHDLDHWTRLGRYLAHDLDSAEQAEVERWASDDAQRRAVVAGMQRLWVPPRIQDTGGVDAALASVQRRAGITLAPARQRGSGRGVFGYSWRRWVPAALAAGLVVLGTSYHASQSTEAISTPSQRFETASGERAIVRWPDGSVMHVAPASVVTVFSNIIDVDGEAYFTIVPNASRAQTVRTKDATIRVLGTSFAVRRYADDRDSRVVVEEGRVTVDAASYTAQQTAATVLDAGMMALVGDSGITLQSDIDAREYVGWTNGLLVFRRAAVGSILTELRRAYGVEVYVADTSLASKRLHIQVAVHEDRLGHVLDLICRATQARVVRSGDRYLLVPGAESTRQDSATTTSLPFSEMERRYGR